ncbi:uncharacterized protein C4orf45 homolog [Tupaia chinensis]|uniref:uncharacterized protein C4orf45 homolog n=1 Tax=Tupaia chinensis TaxID=246437 RepID=UPI000FFC1962|nr:uncharacterized protein C4orf45 homolog [Tupaia chinensis]
MALVSYRAPLSTSVGRRMVYTGPDYIKEHLPSIQEHTTYVGEGQPSPEKTGDLQYLWRPAWHSSQPARYKHEFVGGVGWGVRALDSVSRPWPHSGFHIKYEELSRSAIEKLTHRYQNPWQPKPHILDMRGKHGRGSLAWHMSDYEDTSQRNCKWAVLVRQSQLPPPRASGPPALPSPRKDQKTRCRSLSKPPSTCF